MAAFPSYAKLLLQNYSETFDPSVEKTEMERGPTKERLINTQVTMNVNAVILFEREEDIASFDTWYFDTIKRIGEFDVVHPRTRQTVTMRFKDGYYGDLSPIVGGFALAQRQCTLEYQR